MFYSLEDLKQLGNQYCSLHNIKLMKNLGRGLQGVVYSTSRPSAIKIIDRKDAYLRERDVYLRIQQKNIRQIRGFIIPLMLNYDDDKKVIEMEVVSPPYILDFGGAYLDNPPAHSITPMNMAQYELDKREQFGENWPEVSAILAEFAGLHRIHIVDVNPGNIRFSSAE